MWTSSGRYPLGCGDCEDCDGDYDDGLGALKQAQNQSEDVHHKPAIYATGDYEYRMSINKI